MQQYTPAPKDDAAVVGRMKELASENRRYGYLRLHAMLRREGLVETRRDGKQIFYRISSPAALAVIETLYRLFCESRQ